MNRIAYQYVCIRVVHENANSTGDIAHLHKIYPTFVSSIGRPLPSHLFAFYLSNDCICDEQQITHLKIVFFVQIQ